MYLRNMIFIVAALAMSVGCQCGGSRNACCSQQPTCHSACCQPAGSCGTVPIYPTESYPTNGYPSMSSPTTNHTMTTAQPLNEQPNVADDFDGVVPSNAIPTPAAEPAGEAPEILTNGI